MARRGVAARRGTTGACVAASARRGRTWSGCLGGAIRAWASWRTLEPGPAATLVTVTGLMVGSTLVTLAAPLSRVGFELRPHCASSASRCCGGWRRHDETFELWRRVNAARIVLAATLGTLPLALLLSACIARFLPLSPDARYALAFGLVIPSWLAAMCLVVLVRSGARSLMLCAALTALLAGLVYGVPH